MTTYYLKNDETGVIVDVIAPNRIEAIEMVTTQYGGNAYDWHDRFEETTTISKRDLLSVILEMNISENNMDMLKREWNAFYNNPISYINCKEIIRDYLICNRWNPCFKYEEREVYT